MRRTKTGRRAGNRERELAQRIVELYKSAQAAPGGLLPVDVDEGEPLFFDGNDPSEALSALESFARHGTFEHVDTAPFSLLVLNSEYDALRSSGVGYGEAIHQLAVSRSTSERNIERYLAKDLQELPSYATSVKML